MNANQHWIAAGTEPTSSAIGLVSLLFNLLSKKDRILVMGEHYQPLETNTNGLYVVNLSEHEIHIKDYGFVLDNGKYFSIPAYHAYSYTPHDPYLEFYLQPYFDGSLNLKPREIMKCGKMMHGMGVIGAFAITATQEKPTVHFNVSWYNPKYILARFKIRFFQSFDHRYD